MRKTDNRRGALLALAAGAVYGAYRLYQSRKASGQPEFGGQQTSSAPNAAFGSSDTIPISFDSTPNSTHYLSNPDFDQADRAEPYYPPGGEPSGERQPADRDRE